MRHIRPGSKTHQSPEVREQDARYQAGATATSVYLAAPQDRIAMIKHGLPATRIGQLSARMSMPKERLIEALGMPRATISRKTQANALLSREESERLLGVEYLIGQVSTMVAESGGPNDFDAAKWLAMWIQMPLPALGNATPASYMDTIEGQKLISNLLAMTQSGAYA